MDARLKRLIAKREAANKQREELRESRKAIVDLADEEGREDLHDEEDTEFRDLTSQIAEVDEEITGLDERIKEISDEVERDQQVTDGAKAVRKAQARAEVLSEAVTYRKDPSGPSYLRDLVIHTMNLDGNQEAGERLQRHASEVRNSKEFRDLDRVDTSGGYFVPPAWLMSQWVDLARAGRATANIVSNQQLPAGTDSINIPKVDTGTSTAIQTADNAAVSETDLSDDFVQAPVRTIAGQQDVAVQLLEQSPLNFDEVVFSDLIADYATKLDLQVIDGSGASGQVLGIRTTTGIETVAADTATVKSVYAKIADAVQRVHTLRFMAPTVIVMHPRRWAWFLAAFDTTDRPLVVPSGPGQNQIATFGAVASEQVVGQMHGLPVVTDPNLPTDGTVTGTPPDNADSILVLRASDLWLFESSIRTRVLPEVGSGTLTTRLQVYGYVAFTAGRYPKSVVELAGDGLAAPTF